MSVGNPPSVCAPPWSLLESSLESPQYLNNRLPIHVCVCACAYIHMYIYVCVAFEYIFNKLTSSS